MIKITRTELTSNPFPFFSIRNPVICAIKKVRTLYYYIATYIYIHITRRPRKNILYIFILKTPQQEKKRFTDMLLSPHKVRSSDGSKISLMFPSTFVNVCTSGALFERVNTKAPVAVVFSREREKRPKLWKYTLRPVQLLKRATNVAARLNDRLHLEVEGGKLYFPRIIHLPQRGKEPGHVPLGVEANDVAEMKKARGS